jgi:two-component system sensor histidine kinase TorS
MAAIDGPFTAIFEHAPIGLMLVVAESLRIVRANGPFAAMVNRAPDALGAMNCVDVVDPDHVRDSAAELARLRSGAVASVETHWRYVRPDGSSLFSRTVIAPVTVEPGAEPLLVVMVEDLSQVRRLEERLLLSTEVSGAVIEGTTRYHETMEDLVRLRTSDLVRARDEAESSNRAKSAFLSTVSHELRTPLNAIIGFSELLLDESCPVDEAQRHKQLTIIRESGEQLLELIKEILDVASIESGRLAVKIGRVNLRHVIDEQVRSSQAEAGARHLELRLDSCDSSIDVLADARRLSQVVRNLLSNAIKFTDHGHVAVSVTIHGQFARVEVEDSGIGISEVLRRELFVPFRRIEATLGSLRPGTGLGLAISRWLIEAMGGTIGVESELGVGSRFWFLVPLAEGQLQPA